MAVVLFATSAGAQLVPGPGLGSHTAIGRAKPITEPPPNVLLIVADDLGVDILASYGQGSLLPATPNLDALAAEGMQFTTCYAGPVCSPTRAAMMTGRYTYRNGVGSVIDDVFSLSPPTGLQLSEVIIPELLDQGTNNRYAHGAFGKWHLGWEGLGDDLAPNLAGFDHFAGTSSVIHQPDSYYSWSHTVNGTTIPSTDYATTVTTDDAIDWIRTTPQPWFAYVAFNTPHFPFHQPPAGTFTFDTSSGQAPALYRAMVENMDHNIGRLLDGIPPGEVDNTIVVFLADNGTPPPAVQLPFQHDKAKGTLYEGGVCVPLVVKGPLVQQPGSVCEGLVHAVDLFATVAEIAGVDVAATIPGVTIDSISILPYLADPDLPSLRSVLVSETFHPNHAPSTVWPLPCEGIPPQQTCHTDLGFAGPGNAELAVCGDELYGGVTNSIQVSGARPHASGTIFVSEVLNPTPFLGGVLVTIPIWYQVPIVTNASGSFTGVVFGGAGEADIFYQAVIEDPTQGEGYEISNAIQVEMHPGDNKCARNDRYKLIVNAYTCEREFYDLENDPFEFTNLADFTLSAEEQTAYDELDAAVESMISP